MIFSSQQFFLVFTFFSSSSSFPYDRLFLSNKSSERIKKSWQTFFFFTLHFPVLITHPSRRRHGANLTCRLEERFCNETRKRNKKWKNVEYYTMIIDSEQLPRGMRCLRGRTLKLRWELFLVFKSFLHYSFFGSF